VVDPEGGFEGRRLLAVEAEHVEEVVGPEDLRRLGVELPPADVGDPLRLFEQLLGSVELPLPRFLFRDVPDDADPFAAREQRERGDGVERLSVGPFERRLQARRRARSRPQFGLERRRRCGRLLVDDRRDVSTDQVRLRVADHLGVGVVGHLEGPLLVDDVDPLVDRLDDPLVPFEVPLAFDPLRHVSEIHGQPRLRRVGVDLEPGVQGRVILLEGDRLLGCHRPLVLALEGRPDGRLERVPDDRSDDGVPVGFEKLGGACVEIRELPLVVKREEGVFDTL